MAYGCWSRVPAGVGAGLAGFHQTEQIAVWIPLFLFAFLFGLSMDYEVFLLSRMREEYDGCPTTRAPSPRDSRRPAS